MLDVVFTLYGKSDVGKLFEANKTFQTEPFCEPRNGASPMLEHTPDEVICHADIQDAVGPIGQNVDIAASHGVMMKDVDGRDKPGHDEFYIRRFVISCIGYDGPKT